MAKEEKKGFFARLKEGLAKTRANITDNMDMVFASYDKVTDEFLEELEYVGALDYHLHHQEL